MEVNLSKLAALDMDKMSQQELAQVIVTATKIEALARLKGKQKKAATKKAKSKSKPTKPKEVKTKVKSGEVKKKQKKSPSPDGVFY
jgi:hypothetical protein